jgi:hypothetical protein
MSKIINQKDYIQNGQFSGGAAVTPVSGSTFTSASFENPSFGFVAGGLYVGVLGELTAKTVDGSVLTFTNCYGFLPGLFTAVSASSTAADIIAFK